MPNLLCTVIKFTQVSASALKELFTESKRKHGRSFFSHSDTGVSWEVGRASVRGVVQIDATNGLGNRIQCS